MSRPSPLTSSVGTAEAIGVVAVNNSLEGIVGVDPKCFDRIYPNGWGRRARGLSLSRPAILATVGIEALSRRPRPTDHFRVAVGYLTPPHFTPILTHRRVACAAAAVVYIDMVGQPTAASPKL